MNRLHSVICSSGRWQRIVERELLPWALFAGTDSIGTGRLVRLLHTGDPLVPVSPDGLPERLRAVGVADPAVSQSANSFRFRASKPAPAAR